MNIKSIQFKIAAWSGLCLLVTAGIITSFSVVTLRTESQNTAIQNINAIAEENKSVVKSEVEVAMNAARTLAHTFKSLLNEDSNFLLDRDGANEIMKSILNENPQFLGVYTLWEPDAFDGLDSQYKGKLGHDDTGRFIPYWTKKDDGSFSIEPLALYETEGDGDYYLLPKKNKTECVINPYIYPVQGKDVLLTSLVVPIVHNNKFYGIAGVDFGLEFLQKLADDVNIYEKTGKLVLVSNNGTIAGVSGQADLVGKPIEELSATLKNEMFRFNSGNDVQKYNNGEFTVFTSVNFGKSTTPWTTIIILPDEKVLEASVAMIWKLLLIGISLIVAALVFLLIFSGRLAAPIKMIAENAKRFALGDFDLNNQEQSKLDKINNRSDEIGVTGLAFSQLIEYLKAKADAAIEVSKGNLDVSIEEASEADALSKAMSTMKTSLVSMIDEGTMLSKAAEEGHLGKRCDVSRFEGAYSEIVSGMNKTLDFVLEPINEATNVLTEMAKGNLTTSVTGDYKGDHAKIKDSLNGTINSLNDILGQVMISIDQVSSGSQQVSDSSQSLSQGATEQASSLEEVSSSITEIASQTKTNADNAGQANNLSASAKDNANNGNAQMKNMVEAMNDINESSSEISKIIKVIDEIAFQTNQLALNAAVEAARAGVHGKGFAVVAEEVRNLAMRSAEAAKETTELIEGSSKKVENGSKIADETAKALEEIVDGVSKVTDLVSEIAEASNEQAGGIDQVNTALGQIDQVTQSNTANAEESAAASEELSSQAAQLKQMISKFNLAKSNSIGMSKNLTVPNYNNRQESLAASDSPQDSTIALDDDDFAQF